METVSIIIPAYNAEAFLGEALTSVVEQRCDEKLQIIVVDDGCTDGTANVVRSFPTVEYIRQDNQGAAHARNNGVRNGRGEFIGFLDADDLFTPDKIALQLAVLRNNPELDAVFGHLTEFLDTATGAAQDRKGDEARNRGAGEGRDRNAGEGQHRKPIEYAPAYLQGTMLVRRTFAEKVGPFNESLRVGEFLDWYSRARALGLKESMLPDVVMKRRLHSGNLGLRESQSTMNYASAIRQHLNRMRKSGQVS